MTSKPADESELGALAADGADGIRAWMIAPSAAPIVQGPMGDRLRSVRRMGIDTAVEVEWHDGIPVVRCEGLAVRRTEYLEAIYDGFSTESLAETVTKLALDDNVEAIVIWADSPGGEAHGTGAAAEAIREAARIKPVVGQVQGLGCSAMYYLLCGCSRIVAHAEDVVGSIGVIAQVMDTSERFKAAGIHPVTVTTGPLKGIGIPGAPVTAEQEEHIQRHVDRLFTEFKAFIVAGRGLSPGAVDGLSHGGVFGAMEAWGSGLIDGIATLDETLDRLRQELEARRSKASVPTASAQPWSVDPHAEVTKWDVLMTIPDATSEFAEEAAAAGWRIATVKQVWMRRQQEQLEMLETSLRELNRQLEERKNFKAINPIR